MTKFAVKGRAPNVTSPVSTTEDRVLTYEGHLGYGRDAKSDLFLLAVTNMVREQTFYEEASERDLRFRSLARQVTQEDPDWVARFVPYLRRSMQMRSAPIVLAAEYLKAGGPKPRRVVDSALDRADEPAEMLAYWAQEYGKNYPQPLKRGVADACLRLYTERAALKYDGLGKSWRMGDVIELTHPKPESPEQTTLFRYLLDQRHHKDGAPRLEAETLPLVLSNHALENLPAEERRAVLAELDRLGKAGFTWERLSGWLPGGMDKEAWEAIIPSMGYMALLRNLRNFDEAGVSDEVAEKVARKLSDPDEVARSRQFPYRFLAASKENIDLRWSQALEQAARLSCANLPAYEGMTLVFADVSGSMDAPLSARSKVMRWEIAFLFASALALKGNDARLVAFATDSAELEIDRSILRGVERARKYQGRLGIGTEFFPAFERHNQNEDRLVVFSDMQVFPSSTVISDEAKSVYLFNLGGYAPAMLETGAKGVHEIGGFTDKAFSMLEFVERGKHADWPF